MSRMSIKMAARIFVNLPVKDLKRSVEFFTKLDHTFDPRFTDENATCMIVGENIFVMLPAEKFFKSFIEKELCDATKYTEASVALSVESRAPWARAEGFDWEQSSANEVIVDRGERALNILN